MTRYEQEYYATIIEELPRIRKAIENNTELKSYLNYIESCIDKQIIPDEKKVWQLTKKD